jgi:hypothetical protein
LRRASNPAGGKGVKFFLVPKFYLGTRFTKAISLPIPVLLGEKSVRNEISREQGGVPK